MTTVLGRTRSAIGLAPEAPPAPVRVSRRLRALSRIGFGRADRVTVLLAAATLATAGTVFAGELARRVRRRVVRAEAVGEGLPVTTAEALQVAGAASRDTIRVALAGYGAAGRHETVLFNLLTGFATSFAIARLSTSGIRSGWWPFGNVSIGGRHIHHFVPGILLAFGSATAALLTEDSDREALLAVPFGAGVGLTFDEAALLLDFRDVYWTREGLLSVQLSLGGVVLLAGTILALRMLRRGEEEEERAGQIPDASGDMEPTPLWAAGFHAV